ncbi:MAG: hypothetical protein NTX50_07325 [Candidatus Sumerlaeota bacterium]|nr:hypothetical protein [Candidatus Sumerlaeota bacterium]
MQMSSALRLLRYVAVPSAMPEDAVRLWRRRRRNVALRFGLLIFLYCIADYFGALIKDGWQAFDSWFWAPDLFILPVWSAAIYFWLYADLQTQVKTGALEELWVTLMTRESILAPIMAAAFWPVLAMAFLISFSEDHSASLCEGLSNENLDELQKGLIILCPVIAGIVLYLIGRTQPWIALPIVYGVLKGAAYIVIFSYGPTHTVDLALLWWRLPWVIFAVLAGYALFLRRRDFFVGLVAATTIPFFVPFLDGVIRYLEYKVMTHNICMQDVLTDGGRMLAFFIPAYVFCRLILLLAPRGWRQKTVGYCSHPRLAIRLSCAIAAAGIVWVLYGQLGYTRDFMLLYGRLWARIVNFTEVDEKQMLGMTAFNLLSFGYCLRAAVVAMLLAPGSMLCLRAGARNLSSEWQADGA